MSCRPQFLAGAEGGIVRVRHQFRAGRRRRDLIQAVNPRDLFHQVDLFRQVAPEGRDAHRAAVLARVRHLEFQPAEDRLDFGWTDLEPEEPVHPGISETDRSGRERFRVHVDHPRCGPGAGVRAHQGGGAQAGPGRPLGVDPALEPVRGLRAQAQALGRGPDRGRVERRALQQDGLRILPDFAARPAHHAGHRDRFPGIGDEQGVGGEPALDLVEGRHLLPLAGEPHDDPLLGQQRLVEGMQRFAALEHDEIGDVDHVVDGAHAGESQPLLHPVGRGADSHPLEHPGGVAWASPGIFDVHPGPLFHGRAAFLERRLGQAQGQPAQGRHLAGDADDAEAVGTVGGDLQVQYGLGRAQDLGQRGPGGQGVREYEQAGVVVRETQFVLRAEHALGGLAPDLRLLELHPVGQHGAHRRKRGTCRPASRSARRTPPGSRPCRSFTVHSESRSALGCCSTARDFADHQARVIGADGVHPFHLEAGKRERAPPDPPPNRRSRRSL